MKAKIIKFDKEYISKNSDKLLYDLFYKKIVNLDNCLNEQDFVIIEKLNIKLKSKMCSEVDVKQIQFKMFEYFNFYELEKRNNLSRYEGYLLKEYYEEIDFQEELYKDGYTIGIPKQKNLKNTGINEEQYKETLAKIICICHWIDISRDLKRNIKSEKY